MSTIDQRPIASVRRYRRVRSTGRQRRAAVHRDQQEDQDRELHHRHEDAGGEDDHRERPHAVRQEVDDATHDRVGLRLAERRHRHHRQQVGRHVAERRRRSRAPRCAGGCAACARAARAPQRGQRAPCAPRAGQAARAGRSRGSSRSDAASAVPGCGGAHRSASTPLPDGFGIEGRDRRPPAPASAARTTTARGRARSSPCPSAW